MVALGERDDRPLLAGALAPPPVRRLRLRLPLRLRVFTFVTLTLKIASMACLISTLLASLATTNV